MAQKLSLQRYNQIIWAILGTVALVLIVFAAIGAATHGFGHHEYRGMRIVAVEGAAVKNVLDNRSVHAAMPIEVADSPYQLIPLSVDRLVVSGKFFKVERPRGGYPPAWGGHWGSHWRGPRWDHDWHGAWGDGAWGRGHPAARETPIPGNVLIRDTRNGTTRLLMAQPAVIYRMDYPRVRRDGMAGGDAFPPKGTLYWEIGLADSNGDGVLNRKDAIAAYLSDANGSHMVRISPPQSRVLARAYDAARNILTLKIATDTNGDKTIDGDDKTSLIEVDVAKRKMVGVIFDDAKGQERLKGLTQLNTLPVAH